MKLSNENIILISIILLVIVLVGLDCFLKKKSVLRENFQGFDYTYAVKNTGSDSERFYQDDRKNDEHIKSIVSKYSGKHLNIEPLGQAPTSKITISFMSGDDRKKNVSVNKDGTYKLVIPDKNSIKQQFAVIFVDSSDLFKQHIPLRNESLGYDINDAKYPFYIIKSLADPSRALQFQDGNMMIRPLANYDSQKFDISYEEIDNVIGTSDKTYTNTLVGALEDNGSNGNAQMDKIKIKLNIDNETINNYLEKNLDKILPFKSINSEESDDESVYDVNSGKIDLGSCPLKDTIPANAIKSLCPGCNPNNL